MVFAWECGCCYRQGVTFAHHSIDAFFDRATVSELEGTITQIVWRNPHVGFVLLTGSGAGGEQWALHGAAINRLERGGIVREVFGVGDRVRVAGWPDKRGRNAMFVTNLLLPSGNELRMYPGRGQRARWTEDGESGEIDIVDLSDSESRGQGIFRVWTLDGPFRNSTREPLVLTEAAVTAREAWDPLTDDPSLRCVPPGLPNAMLSPFPFEFIDRGDTIRMRVEEWDAIRTIHMTSEQDPEDVMPSPMGHSVGRWEGRTLVVDTSRINWAASRRRWNPAERRCKDSREIHAKRGRGPLKLRNHGNRSSVHSGTRNLGSGLRLESERRHQAFRLRIRTGELKSASRGDFVLRWK